MNQLTTTTEIIDLKTLPLTQGKVTVVDDDVYEWASKFKWHAIKSRTAFYAERISPRTLGPRKKILLHREIMQPAEGLEVGHEDGNGLNNLRENLQNITHQQNTWGKRAKGPNATSLFRGVCRHKKNSTWMVHCTKNEVRHYLGCFQDEVQAAKAYDAKARELFGEHAACNFPKR